MDLFSHQWTAGIKILRLNLLNFMHKKEVRWMNQLKHCKQHMSNIHHCGRDVLAKIGVVKYSKCKHIRMDAHDVQ